MVSFWFLFRHEKPFYLGDQIPPYLPVHVGEAEIPATPAVGQLLVIDAQLVQYRRPQVVNRGDILNRTVAQLVGRTVSDTALHLVDAVVALVATLCQHGADLVLKELELFGRDLGRQGCDCRQSEGQAGEEGLCVYERGVSYFSCEISSEQVSAKSS